MTPVVSLRCRVAGLLILVPFQLALAVNWRPVEPADLAVKTSTIEKNSDAEGLFWDVRLSDEGFNTPDWFTVRDEYLRVKIFTTRGRERFQTIEIPEPPGVSTTDIAARAIRPDGTVIPLKQEAIHERLIARAGKTKVNYKSFAIPGMDLGSIIEWRFRQRITKPPIRYRPLQFQQDFPLRSVTYYVKPYTGPNFRWVMMGRQFNIANPERTNEPDGYVRITERNVPAYHLEPDMPPIDQIRAWMLIYYQPADQPQGKKYWDQVSSQFYQAYKLRLKVNGEVKRTASEIISGATTDDQKLRLLYDFCRLKIRNTGGDDVSADERADAKANRTPSDTIKQMLGTAQDIDYAFAALATAVGYETRLAHIEVRNSGGELPQAFADPYFFLAGQAIAVQTGDSWRFFHPGNRYLPFGVLPSRFEGAAALIADPKEARFVLTPITPPANNGFRERATLSLSEEGALEGDVVMEYYGHPGTIRKEAAARQSEDQLIEGFRESIQRQIAGSEISGVKIENATDPERPITYRFHLKSPHYAQRTGKRLFFQPDVFRYGAKPLFPNAERIYPLFFPFAWSEQDEITISLPNGYALDNVDIPGSIKFGDAGEYVVRAQVQGGRQLIYSRRLDWGAKNTICLPATSYPTVKKIFDSVNLGDTRIMVLKVQDSSKPSPGATN